MALTDDLQQLLTLLDEDRSFASRLLSDVQMCARLGIATPTTNVTTERNAINTALRTERQNLHDAARKIRAEIEASVDA